MSPNAYLPTLPPYLYTPITVATLAFLLFVLGGSTGNLPVTVSLLPFTTVLTRTSCLGQTVPIGGCKLHSDRSSPEFDTDLCQCLSLPCLHCNSHTFLAQLSNKPFLFSLIFSCIASCISSLMQLAFPSGSQKGVGGKRRSGSPFLPFALPCCQIPTAGGYPFLGFTPCPRPRVRGPAPYLLTKLGFLPSSFHGVGEKTASRAVSLLSLFCLLLFLFVFAQTRTAQDALHLLKPLQGVEPKERVFFATVLLNL